MTFVGIFSHFRMLGPKKQALDGSGTVAVSLKHEKYMNMLKETNQLFRSRFTP